MKTQKHVISIFLSSPGDVGAQRDVARQVISSLNSDPLIAPKVILEIVGWDTPGARVPTSANKTPQASINDFLDQPSQCDLTIVLLWGRLGTPLPANWSNSHGRAYPSGTVWELENARSNGKPVWIYHKSTPPQASINDPLLHEKIKQFESVREFLDSSKQKDGSLTFGKHEFCDDEELRQLLTEHLKHFIGKSIIMQSDEKAISSTKAETSNALAKQVSDLVAAYNTDQAHNAKSLRPLSEYPTGPMIKDVIVNALAQAFAETHEGTHPRNVLSKINEALRIAAEPEPSSVRLTHVAFPSSMGSCYFWEEVLYWSAVQGPRVLAATLGAINAQKIEGEALLEYEKLVARLNSYVQ